jgi:hypothetical protein
VGRWAEAVQNFALEMDDVQRFALEMDDVQNFALPMDAVQRFAWVACCGGSSWVGAWAWGGRPVCGTEICSLWLLAVV